MLLPLSLPYGLITRLRNYLYDKEILESTSFDVPVITVGNLSVGGTGKTPMIEFLLEILLPEYRTATLSRGYGRKTKGYLEVKGDETAEKVGDEPLQFKQKFPQAVVTVDENRSRGISNLLSRYKPEVILLDDAYQHRKVKAGFTVLLTTYHNLYVDDWVLPAGDLREPKAGAGRADVVIITKCPETLNKQEQNELKKKMKLQPHQKLFFSYIQYADHLFGKAGEKFELNWLKGKNFSLVTGIAKPGPLLEYLKGENFEFNHLQFPDHHNFSAKEIESISRAETIVTTEKDYMRLKNSLSHPHLYYLPIKIGFLNEDQELKTLVCNFINEK